MYKKASTIVLKNFAHCVSHWNLFHCTVTWIVRRMGIIVFVNGSTDIRRCEKWHQRQRKPFRWWGKLLQLSSHFYHYSIQSKEKNCTYRESERERKNWKYHRENKNKQTRDVSDIDKWEWFYNLHGIVQVHRAHISRRIIAIISHLNMHKLTSMGRHKQIRNAY